MATFADYLRLLYEYLRTRTEPTPPPPPLPPPQEFYFSFFVRDAQGMGILGATVMFRRDSEYAWTEFTTNDQGRVTYPTMHPGVGVNVRVSKEGYLPYEGRRTMPLNQHDPPADWPEGMVLLLIKKPLPAPLSMEQLARVRGAMWTVRWNGPMGPRPGQDSNILAMDFYEHYGPDDRKRMIEIYKSRGYTHAVTGPIIAGGYHGWWPESTSIDQAKWDHYLDAMQEWREAGIIPIHFMSPDNWSLEQCQATFSDFYRQPRAQALLPIKVPRGWEPGKYTASSRTWALWGDWGAEVSAPGTLIMAHTVCDVDALVGGDERYNDDGHPNGEGWQYVAPHFHGWLIQLCGYVDAMGERDPSKRAEMLAAWRVNLPAQFQSYNKRFRHGYAGWPTGSKWGPNIPMKLYLAECASYPFFHDGAITEDMVREWGDVAMANHADGYLDGGSVEVP